MSAIPMRRFRSFLSEIYNKSGSSVTWGVTHSLFLQGTGEW